MPPHGPALSLLDTLCCPEADGPTNLEQPTLNHVQSDTMASAVLADPTRAVQGTNRGSGPAIEKSENDLGRPTSAWRTILRFSLLVVFLVASDPVFHAWVPSHVHYSQQFLTAYSERST
ncbi:hypothetical protein TNCV_846891 [Trichonephila clavipes]|nr:hypothetical protein TNCV_846891 [Trichonephila clavipes]